MTLKEHYAKFKITTGPSLMKECFQMFSQVIMDSKKVGKYYFTGDDWPLF